MGLQVLIEINSWQAYLIDGNQFYTFPSFLLDVENRFG